jgi:hypothetical protein
MDKLNFDFWGIREKLSAISTRWWKWSSRSGLFLEICISLDQWWNAEWLSSRPPRFLAFTSCGPTAESHAWYVKFDTSALCKLICNTTPCRTHFVCAPIKPVTDNEMGSPMCSTGGGLKGPSHHIRFACKWYGLDRPRLGHVSLDFKHFYPLPLICIGPMRFLCDPHLTFTIHFFLWKTDSVDIGRLLISAWRSPKVAGPDLDVTGSRLQLHV